MKSGICGALSGTGLGAVSAIGFLFLDSWISGISGQHFSVLHCLDFPPFMCWRRAGCGDVCDPEKIGAPEVSVPRSPALRDFNEAQGFAFADCWRNRMAM